MLLVEENHLGVLTITHVDRKMLYTEEDRSRGRGGRGGSERNRSGLQEQNRRHGGGADNSSRPSGSRGSQDGIGNRQGKTGTDCWYSGRKDHRESECRKKKADADKFGSGRTKQGNKQRSHYAEGSEGPGNGLVSAFVMNHKANSMA